MNQSSHAEQKQGRIVTADGYCEEIGPRYTPVSRREGGSTRTDTEIRADIEAELQWQPSIDDQKVFVHVHQGVATLFGEVSTYMARYAVEEVVKHCAGVVAIANDLVVRIPPENLPTDTEIAENIIAALGNNPLTRTAQIKPVVRDGGVTMFGSVNWPFQQRAAESIAWRTPGVRFVGADLTVKSKVYANRLRQAFSFVKRLLA